MSILLTLMPVLLSFAKAEVVAASNTVDARAAKAKERLINMDVDYPCKTINISTFYR